MPLCEGRQRGFENPRYKEEVKLESDEANLLEEHEQVSAVAVSEQETSVHEINRIEPEDLSVPG